MNWHKRPAWWAHRQGLDGRLSERSLPEIIETTGWARTVGGANPYQTLFARCDVSRAEIDAAVAQVEIHELPAARGCTYLVPRSQFGLALAAGTGFTEVAEQRTAVKYLGVTSEEIERLKASVLDALSNEVLEPKALRDRLGDQVRSLGEEGKKRGQTTTLPLALGSLQIEGRIRRVPVDGRLDQQRYAYTRWDPAPTKPDPEAARAELARLFFDWIGPATLKDFQNFGAFTVAQTKAAVAGLELVSVDGDPEMLMPVDLVDDYERFEVPSEPSVRLISTLDSLFLLRRNAGEFIHPTHFGRHLAAEKGKLLEAGGHLKDLTADAIVDRGQIIGLWLFDHDAGEIVAHFFEAASPEARQAVAQMEAKVRDELGDVRCFSLDSPAGRRPQVAAMRQLAQEASVSTT